MTRQPSKKQRRASKKKPVTLETVRGIALALPQVEEGLSGRLPVFRVRGKLLARLHEDGQALAIKIDYLKRDILLNAEPETFYINDFYRCFPMIFVRLSSVDRRVLESLFEDGWRLLASKRAVEAYDAEASG
ncbi:MAG TPA: MmcQ/YjbR family DNA-binding protein [Blastocatellia bacterium]|nr:MmcQ/YjbR family DNA-binding protein [Blastocatellia bacterium]